MAPTYKSVAVEASPVFQQVPPSYLSKWLSYETRKLYYIDRELSSYREQQAATSTTLEVDTQR